MSAEFWAIVGVGVAMLAANVALLTLGWLAFNSLRQEVATVRERLAGVETTLNLLVKGLRIEIQGGSAP